MVIRLLKFRSLRNRDDLKSIKGIVESGKFWCSKLWNLNDPMEGIYRNSDFNHIDIKEMFNEKNNHIICSFSWIKALNNPLLWGYYANGYRGIAIEIEIDSDRVEKIEYKSKTDFNKNMNNVKQIITRKLKNWNHEREYRYLLKNKPEDFYPIGMITKIHFGNPYANINNRNNVIDNSHTLREFENLKKELICLIEETNKEKNKYEQIIIKQFIVKNN